MHQPSIWEKESFYALQDVIIVGSGFTGLWSALYTRLLHPDYKITILDRAYPPTGASTRNAGFSCFGSPSELIADARAMGENAMWELVSRRYDGILAIRKFFTDEEIDYNPCGGYECFQSDLPDWIECSQQLDWLNAGLKKITGEKTVFTVADEKLAGFGFKGFSHLIENKLEGSLHPGKLVKALLKKIQSMDIQVIPGIEVLNYTNDNEQVVIKSRQQIEFTTRQLLLCTNAFTQSLVPGIDVIPNRGQVLVTDTLENLPIKAVFHFDRGFYYFRNIGNRLLLGGARNKAFDEENTMELATTENIQQELENFIRDHLLPGRAFTISDRWAGIMGMGAQKSPIVKMIEKNIYCCVRMSGMGVALAPIVAREITALMNDH